MAFLKTELPKELKKRRFLVGGKWYEFKYEANKLLFGEYVNIMEILQKANNNEEVIYENLHKILTIICRPVYKTMFGYKDAEVDGELIKQTADNFFNNMPITIAYPIGVFFYNHLPTLTETIKTSLMEVANKKIWGWWSLIDSLCNSRVDKFEVVQNWNVVYGLNMCCYFKDKQRMEQQAHREQMQRLKRR
jgi:hypothetical protein